MLHRLLLATMLTLCLAFSASSQNIPHPLDEKLEKAAQRLKAKDYRGARENARAADDAPEKYLIAGVSAYRLEDWAEAADLLGKAAKELPLLADYSLSWQANALYRDSRYEESIEVLKTLIREWPESAFIRTAKLLYADNLFALKNFKDAKASYIRFVEIYPSGRDSLTAVYQAARCREGLGEEEKAVQELRSLWLSYPASPVAEDAEEKMRELASKGFPAAPYTADELFRRAGTLYNLGRYQQAVKAFDAIPLANQPAEFIARLTLNSGQALYKARHFTDAERTFARLAGQELPPDLADKVYFWHAKALERIGKSDEGFSAYLRIAEKSHRGALADDALLEAAFIRKFQGRYQEQYTLLDRLLSVTTNAGLRQRATWEAAWALFNVKDFAKAADFFKALHDSSDYRERAIYWHARALEAAGDKEGAAASFVKVQEEFPLTYYGYQARAAMNIGEEPPSITPAPPLSSLPIPPGFERIKLLISVGLHAEARKELFAIRKRNGLKEKTLLGVARLYLEMGDYNSAGAIYRGHVPRRIDGESITQWGLIYPQAFRETVARQAAGQKVPLELVYAIIKAESSFSPTVVSPAGAVGLMQLMPSTAKGMVTGENGTGAIATRLTDPEFNVSLGVRHLKWLLDQYNGDTVAAVAAYNAGSAPVDRWRRNLSYQRNDEFIENIPYYETREYVKKVFTGTQLYRTLYPAHPDKEAHRMPPASAGVREDNLLNALLDRGTDKQGEATIAASPSP